MRYTAIISALLLIWSASATGGTACRFRPSTPAPSINPLVKPANWLAVEHLRIGLDAPQRFMPGTAMRSQTRSADLAAAPNPIDLDRLTVVDPGDGVKKNLRALLDARLYVDGILVLQGDRIRLEHYRAGFSAESPRLLLQSSRPLLTAMLANAVEGGRLGREHSLARVLPELGNSANLRKISVQRLLDDRTELSWSAADRRRWLYVSGWKASSQHPHIRDVGAWLKNRTDWPRHTKPQPPETGGPEGELLIRVLKNATGQSVSRYFCDSVLAGIGAEHEAFWASDPAGTELADGLALSLRDFARFGMALIRARSARGAGKIAPRWFVASLAESGVSGEAPPLLLRGLGTDIGWKYRFVIAGQNHQAAIVGPFGNSLLIDFDRKLVIALYASVPKDYSALALASLRSLWSAIGREIDRPVLPR